MILWYFSDRKILFDYEIYGDSPICLNDKFDISNKEATIQGFGIADSKYSNAEEANLKQAKVVTVSNENCTKWVQANAEELETFKLPYGNGFTFNELPNGINKEILCSRGILQEDGSISVSTLHIDVVKYEWIFQLRFLLIICILGSMRGW